MHWRLPALKSNPLTVGDMTNIALTKIEDVSSNRVGKFRLKGIIPSQELNSYIVEYKEEMKRKKVIIPGFRPGVIPPHAMPEIRSFVVSHGLETILSELCNINRLRVSLYYYS